MKPKSYNPMPSKSPCDAVHNIEALDEFTNSQEPTYEDRFDQDRQTLSAMKAGMEDRFQETLLKIGYEQLGDYAAGLEITEYNQIFRHEGEWWRASASLELPYTTTGDWGAEEALFVGVGDAALRQELASPVGAEMVGYKGGSVADFLGAIVINNIGGFSVAEKIEGITYRLVEYHAGHIVGGGEFIYSSDLEKSKHNGGTVISPTVPFGQSLADYLDGNGESDPSGTGCFIRADIGSINVFDFGALGKGAEFIDFDDAAIKKAALEEKNLVFFKNSDAGYFVKSVTLLKNGAYGVNKPKITILKDFAYTNGAVNDGKAQIFRFYNSTRSCHVTGFHFVGDFSGTTGAETEHAHHIAISSSGNIDVSGNYFERPYGDGVYIGKYNWGDTAPQLYDACFNIKVHNNQFEAPRRCFAAFVSCTTTRFFNNIGVKRNAFVGALDVEPNLGDGTFVNGVEIYDNDISAIAGRAVVFYAPSNQSVRNITVRNNVIDALTSVIDTSSLENTRVMRNIRISGNRTRDLAAQSMQYFLLIRNPIIGLEVHNNFDLDSGRWLVSGSPGGYSIQGNRISGNNSADNTKGIIIRDGQGGVISDNIFDGITVSGGYGAINLVKTTGPTARSSGFVVTGNKAVGVTNFLGVINESGSTDPLNFIVENSIIDENVVDVSGNAVTQSAGATVTRTSFKNRIINGAISPNFPYTSSGNRKIISIAPDYVGQMAEHDGGLYLAVRGDAGSWVRISA